MIAILNMPKNVPSIITMIVQVPELNLTLTKPQYWFQSGISFVSIKKAISKYEKEILSNSEMRGSVFFPDYVSYTENADGRTATLSLRADDYLLANFNRDAAAEIGMPLECFASSL